MTVYPANGGVVIEDGRYQSINSESTSPRVGYVIAVGGGVPWLKPDQCVMYDPALAGDPDAAMPGNGQVPRVLVCDQKAILATLPDVRRARDDHAIPVDVTGSACGYTGPVVRAS